MMPSEIMCSVLVQLLDTSPLSDISIPVKEYMTRSLNSDCTLMFVDARSSCHA
jgi:hypothetical protein